jgi:hypothetical protein
MDDAISHLHDATMTSIQYDWQARTCEIFFAGAPTFQSPFSLFFVDVSALGLSANAPWGPSGSVLKASISPGGKVSIAMQSGDSVTLSSPNYSFKPTPSARLN